jgi:hypothetical protein
MAKKYTREEPLLMGGIPIDRLHSYESTFFKSGLPVLQGVVFPLEKKTFKSGSIHLDEKDKVLGTPRRSTDVRNVSYALG